MLHTGWSNAWPYVLDKCIFSNTVNIEFVHCFPLVFDINNHRLKTLFMHSRPLAIQSLVRHKKIPIQLTFDINVRTTLHCHSHCHFELHRLIFIGIFTNIPQNKWLILKPMNLSQYFSKSSYYSNYRILRSTSIA